MHGRMDANPIVLDETADDVVVVVVEGEHDIYTAPTLRERLEEALGARRRHRRRPDRPPRSWTPPCSARCWTRAGARSRPARATSSASATRVEPGVQRILDITGLVPVLPVLQGRDEAIEAARSTNGAGE